MKHFLVFLSLTALVFGSGYIIDPEAFRTGAEFLGEVTDEALYSREFRIHGLQRVSRAEILERLPQEESNFTWIFSPEHVVQRMKQDARIKEASLKRCSFFSFSCFELEVVERQPAFITQLGSRPWLVSEDGGFIRPLEQEVQPALPVVEGVLTESLSPELMKSRLAYVAKAIKILEDVLGAKAEQVVLSKSGELSLSFKELPFPVIFDGSRSDFSRLEIEAARLKKILARPGVNFRDIEKIDLAFKRLGVVKLKEVPQETK